MTSDSLEEEYEWDLRHKGAGWIVGRDKNYPIWEATFKILHPKDGKIGGAVAKEEFIKSKLPSATLAK